MKTASKFLTGVAALSLMTGAAFAQSMTTKADGSDDPSGFVRDAKSEATEMPTNMIEGDALLGKTVMTSDGEVVGVVDGVAEEADNRQRIYVNRSEAMGGGIFSVVVPENYVPEDTIELGMSMEDVKKPM
ncbi:hypothetical protein [Frigidibacter sp. MR17.24]|uniref:hypothetical protein n=1 Tax=Frigidibacter sp. MR17.24 TaxID=3127345 RepID=UPI003012DC1B